MLDYLYALGQTLCLLGLGWGAWLVVTASELATTLREAGFRHRPRSQSRRQRRTAAEDPHVSSLGYWP